MGFFNKTKLLISFILCWLSSALQSFSLTEHILEKFWCCSLLFPLCVLDHIKDLFTDCSFFHWGFCPGVIHLYVQGIKPMLSFWAVVVWVSFQFPEIECLSQLSLLAELPGEVVLWSPVALLLWASGSRLLMLMGIVLSSISHSMTGWES